MKKYIFFLLLTINGRRSKVLLSKIVTYLEEYYTLLTKENADSTDIRATIIKLRNAYYNLIILGVPKEKEFDDMEKLLEMLD